MNGLKTPARMDAQGETPSEITRLLRLWGKGDGAAFQDLMESVYLELRHAAKRHLQNEMAGHTLSPTGLIHEVYIRLSDETKMHFEGRAQFFWFAGQLMRRILVEHARAKLTQKRGLGQVPLPLEDLADGEAGQELDLNTLLALDQALTQLQDLDPRLARLIELRFFAGLNNGEIAELLNIARTTVKRDWRLAKLLLARTLRAGSPFSIPHENGTEPDQKPNPG